MSKKNKTIRRPQAPKPRNPVASTLYSPDSNFTEKVIKDPAKAKRKPKHRLRDVESWMNEN